MKKVISYLLLGIGGLALIGVCGLLFLFIPGGIGLPIRWELPDGYKGWVVLRSGDPSCKPYERQGLWLVVPVANDGSACVSNPRDPKWRFEYFVYVHPDASTTRVDDVRGEHADYSLGVVDASFIGTEAELKRAPLSLSRPLVQ
jgi:hypothetical protein